MIDTKTFVWCDSITANTDHPYSCPYEARARHKGRNYCGRHARRYIGADWRECEPAQEKNR